MSKYQAGLLNIAISVVFAAGMIVARCYVNDESSSLVMGLLIAIWFVPFSLLSNYKGECARAEVKCRDSQSGHR